MDARWHAPIQLARLIFPIFRWLKKQTNKTNNNKTTTKQKQ